MLVTTHVLSGAVIGALAPDLPTALTRGFASHFVLDAIPRSQRKQVQEVLARSAEALQVVLRDGVDKAMSLYN